MMGIIKIKILPKIIHLKIFLLFAKYIEKYSINAI